MINQKTLKSFIDLSKSDFLRWNCDNQFFNEENNEDFMNFPENISKNIIVKRNLLKLYEFTKEFNNAINQIIADGLFSVADKIRVASDNMIYLVIGKEVRQLMDFDLREAYRIAKKVRPDQNCGLN